MPRQQRREISAGVLLLLYQILTVGYDNIPPVTLLTIAAQTAIFLGLIPALDQYRIVDICVLPNRIWNMKEWKRLFFSSFVHGDDMHLYYNMISFLWKGRRLERRVGSYYFAYMLAVFSVLVNVILVALSILLDDVWGMGFSQQCAVGFSGVIFAFKVLCNHYFPHEDAFLMGWVPVPSQLACWAELFLIQLLVPNASFVGHLAGILVGLAYVKGPLKPIMDMVFGLVSPAPRGQRYTGASGATGYAGRQYRPREDFPHQDDKYNHYTGGLSEEEQVRRAMEESLNGYARSRPSAPGFEYDHGRLYPNLYD